MAVDLGVPRYTKHGNVKWRGDLETPKSLNPKPLQKVKLAAYFMIMVHILTKLKSSGPTRRMLRVLCCAFSSRPGTTGTKHVLYYYKKTISDYKGTRGAKDGGKSGPGIGRKPYAPSPTNPKPRTLKSPNPKP